MSNLNLFRSFNPELLSFLQILLAVFRREEADREGKRGGRKGKGEQREGERGEGKNVLSFKNQHFTLRTYSTEICKDV